MIALVVITTGMAALLGALHVSAVATAGLSEVDSVRFAMEDAAEALRRERFGEIYAKYHGKRVQVEGLVGPDGEPAAIEFRCYVDERALPVEFGPVLDIDGSGGLETADCSATYSILPVRLRLTYAAPAGLITRRLYLVLEPRS